MGGLVSGGAVWGGGREGLDRATVYLNRLITHNRLIFNLTVYIMYNTPSNIIITFKTSFTVNTIFTFNIRHHHNITTYTKNMFVRHEI